MIFSNLNRIRFKGIGIDYMEYPDTNNSVGYPLYDGHSNTVIVSSIPASLALVFRIESADRDQRPASDLEFASK